MKRELKISFNWESLNGDAVKPHHEDALHKAALEYLVGHTNSGTIHSSKPLRANVCLPEEGDPEEGVTYKGWVLYSKEEN